MVDSNRNPRSAAIDAARGLAASLVLIHHLDVLYPGAISGLLGEATIARKLVRGLSDMNPDAVMLFFVISGFCIRATSRKFDFSCARRVGDYALRRAARIIPLYLFALGFTFLCGVAMRVEHTKPYTLATLVGNIFFLQTPDGTRGQWFVPYGANGPLWSISYEVFYYAIFPAMALIEARLISGRDRVAILVRVLTALVVSLLGLISYNLIPNPIFLFLTLYFVWCLGARSEEVYHARMRPYGLIGLLAGLGVAMGIVIELHASATLRLMLSGTVIGIVWLFLQSHLLASRFANLWPCVACIKPLAKLGGVSYGLYLIHYPTLSVCRFVFGDSTIGFTVAVIGSVALAYSAEIVGGHVKEVILSRPVARETIM